MVLNLKIINGFPQRPTRSCLKNTGPLELILITIPISSIRGSRHGIAISEQEISSTRFQSGTCANSAATISSVERCCCWFSVAVKDSATTADTCSEVPSSSFIPVIPDLRPRPSFGIRSGSRFVGNGKAIAVIYGARFDDATKGWSPNHRTLDPVFDIQFALYTRRNFSVETN